MTCRRTARMEKMRQRDSSPKSLRVQKRRSGRVCYVDFRTSRKAAERLAHGAHHALVSFDAGGSLRGRGDGERQCGLVLYWLRRDDNVAVTRCHERRVDGRRGQQGRGGVHGYI